MALSSGTFTNGGTINLSGGVMVFTNTVAGASFTGTFLNNGVIAGFGTNSLNPTFNLHEGSGFNPNFVNAGVILASNGLLMINAADSFTQGGFSNAANGTVAVSNGATFAVNKTANYWNHSGPWPTRVRWRSMAVPSRSTTTAPRRTAGKTRASPYRTMGQSSRRGHRHGDQHVGIRLE